MPMIMIVSSLPLGDEMKIQKNEQPNNEKKIKIKIRQSEMRWHIEINAQFST